MLIQTIFFILFSGILLHLFVSKNREYLQALIGLLTSSAALMFSIVFFLEFDARLPSKYNFSFELNWGGLHEILHFGVFDATALYFLVLTTFLIFCCMVYILRKKNFKYLAILLLLIEILLLVQFLALNLAVFYVFFEAVLIPMYLVIGVGGSRERKIHAGYMFFFYTLCSSLLFLLGILYIYSIVGSLDYHYLFAYNFSKEDQLLLWLCFFLSFASKIPMYPFHIWLPEAHVEAPTVGSVILAGVLLKLGVYGMIRFSLTLFPYASLYFSPLVYLLSTIGIIYASLTAIRQTDLKRIIAYSSVAHMNLVTLGIFSFNVLGMEGAILQSLSHGFVAGGMFFLIGILYDRYHSRFLHYYGGLVHMMPIYAILLLIFTLANIALPGTSSFVGEFLLLTGIYKMNAFVAAVAAIGVILCGAYSLWLYNRMIFGNLKIDYTIKFRDMDLQEFLVLMPLLILIFIMGVDPSIFTDYLPVTSNVYLFMLH